MKIKKQEQILSKAGAGRLLSALKNELAVDIGGERTDGSDLFTGDSEEIPVQDHKTGPGAGTDHAEIREAG